MSRSTVRCSEAHTPQSPNKNCVRRDWLKPLNGKGDIITISHGLLESAMMVEHKGCIWVCDIDPGVIESTKYARQSEYLGELHIHEKLCSIQTQIKTYLNDLGPKDLKVVDVDLADCLKTVYRICDTVLRTLVEYKASGVKVMLTFRNGRLDGFKDITGRINWLRNNIPSGVKYIKHKTYNSGRITEFAERKKGSAMCIVEMEIR